MFLCAGPQLPFQAWQVSPLSDNDDSTTLSRLHQDQSNFAVRRSNAAFVHLYIFHQSLLAVRFKQKCSHSQQRFQVNFANSSVTHLQMKSWVGWWWWARRLLKRVVIGGLKSIELERECHIYIRCWTASFQCLLRSIHSTVFEIRRCWHQSSFTPYSTKELGNPKHGLETHADKRCTVCNSCRERRWRILCCPPREIHPLRGHASYRHLR